MWVSFHAEDVDTRPRAAGIQHDAIPQVLLHGSVQTVHSTPPSNVLDHEDVAPKKEDEADACDDTNCGYWRS